MRRMSRCHLRGLRVQHLRVFCLPVVVLLVVLYDVVVIDLFFIPCSVVSGLRYCRSVLDETGGLLICCDG